MMASKITIPVPIDVFYQCTEEQNRTFLPRFYHNSDTGAPLLTFEVKEVSSKFKYVGLMIFAIVLQDFQRNDDKHLKEFNNEVLGPGNLTRESNDDQFLKNFGEQWST